MQLIKLKICTKCCRKKTFNHGHLFFNTCSLVHHKKFYSRFILKNICQKGNQFSPQNCVFDKTTYFPSIPYSALDLLLVNLSSEVIQYIKYCDEKNWLNLS